MVPCQRCHFGLNATQLPRRGSLKGADRFPARHTASATPTMPAGRHSQAEQVVRGGRDLACLQPPHRWQSRPHYQDEAARFVCQRARARDPPVARARELLLGFWDIDFESSIDIISTVS